MNPFDRDLPAGKPARIGAVDIHSAESPCAVAVAAGPAAAGDVAPDHCVISAGVAPRRPDLRRDRLIVVVGATMPGFEPVMQPWLHCVGHKLPDQPLGTWVRPLRFLVSHEVMCGTIDELVEAYRQRLTRAAEAYLQPDAAEGVNWEANAKLQDSLAVQGVNGVVTGVHSAVAYPADGAVAKARRARMRVQLDGAYPPCPLTPEQEELVGDLVGDPASGGGAVAAVNLSSVGLPETSARALGELLLRYADWRAACAAVLTAKKTI